MERVSTQPLKCPKETPIPRAKKKWKRKPQNSVAGRRHKKQRKNGRNPKAESGLRERERGNQIVGRQGTAGKSREKERDREIEREKGVIANVRRCGVGVQANRYHALFSFLFYLFFFLSSK